MITKEEKQLLFKDLCARLSYGVICKITANDNPYIGDHKLSTFWLDKVTDICYEIKPYLRLMSSITKEELDERNQIALFHSGNIASAPTYIDWLNAHHFDYRGLIRKGLALEAPEGMYNNNKD